MDSVAGPPSMSLADIRTMLGADGRPEYKTEALLLAHGIANSRSSHAMVAADVCFRLFAEHASLVEDEAHRVLGNTLKPGATNLMIARMLLCDSIADALRAYAEATSIIVPELTATITCKRSGLSILWRTANADSNLHQIVLEGTAAVFYGVFSWLAGNMLPVQRVRAPLQRKFASSTLLRLMGAPIIYAGKDLELVFPPEVGARRIRNLDIGVWRDGVHQIFLRAILNTRAWRERSEAFTDKVRGAMLEGLDQQTLALSCGISTKTIARRLAQEGHTFREIRDEVRKQKSISLIHDELTIEKIGEILGYEDERSFRRAFQRWFGISPSTYRSQRGGRQSSIPLL